MTPTQGASASRSGGNAGSVLYVLVRDRQNRAGAVLAVAPDVWGKFTNGLK